MKTRIYAAPAEQGLITIVFDWNFHPHEIDVIHNLKWVKIIWEKILSFISKSLYLLRS